jgi:hypothetical protein
MKMLVKTKSWSRFRERARVEAAPALSSPDTEFINQALKELFTN